jgi:hypothetical protein
MTLLAIANAQLRMVQCSVNANSERIRKEAVVASGGTSPEIASNDSRMPWKTSVTTAEDAAKIGPKYLPHTAL